jgi:hypothetical protein
MDYIPFWEADSHAAGTKKNLANFSSNGKFIAVFTEVLDTRSYSYCHTQFIVSDSFLYFQPIYAFSSKLFLSVNFTD